MIYNDEAIKNSLIGVLGTPEQLKESIFEIGKYFKENQLQMGAEGVLTNLHKTFGLNEVSIIYLLCAYSYFEKIELPTRWITEKITSDSNVLVPAFYVAYINKVVGY